MRTHRGLAGIFSSAGVGILTMAAAILLVPFILSAVSAAQYGLWLVLTSTAMLLYYSDLGVGSAIVHYSARMRGGGDRFDAGQLLSAGLLWNTFAAVGVVPVYTFTAHWYISNHADEVGLDPSSRTELLIASALIMATILIRPFNSALAGIGYLPIERRNQGIAAVFRVAATLLVCWLIPSITMIAAVEAAAILLPPLLSALTIVRLKQHRITWTRSTFASMRSMLNYSSRAFASSLIESALLQGGTIAAGVLSTPADATYFNIAFRIYSSVRQLINWITEPLRPAMSRLYSVSKSEADAVLYALSRILLLGSTLGCVILILAGPMIVRAWLGPGVSGALIAATSTVLLAGLIANCLHLPFAAAAYAAGHPAAFLLPQILWLASFLALATPLSIRWGTVGIAVSLVMPLLIVEPLCLLIVRRVLDIKMTAWLIRNVVPIANLLLPGTLSASFCLVMARDASPIQVSAIVTASFIAGVAVAALMQPRTIPVDSFRIIFRTEL